MKKQYSHDLKVDEILHKFNRLKLNQNSSANSFETKEFLSNRMSSHSYQNLRRLIGLDNLNEIIEIDTKNQVAYVEPHVPMDELFDTLAKTGLMVPVIPEFKGITVGGAINGAAIESSSHQFGQFSDCCLSYEVLIGSGKIMRVSPEENSDLFYAISGSYGTFGIVTLVKLKLIPFFPYVLLNYHKFKSIAETFSKIKELQKNENKPDFIEGIVFSSDTIFLIEGFLKTAESVSHIKQFNLNKLGDWFYQHLFKKGEEDSLLPEKMKTKDYIFRHDKGAFWMGAYAADLKLFSRYYLEARGGFKKFSKAIFGTLTKGVKVKPTGFFFKLFFSWWMTSRKLYRMLHRSSESWFNDRFIIQDFYLPIQDAENFLKLAIEKTRIFPIWLCPIRGTKNPELFSPNFLDEKKVKQKEEKEEWLIDIGLYGMAEKVMDTAYLNRFLDDVAKRYGAKKMLYSFNSYSKEEFFKIYSKDKYEEIRRKYEAEGVFTAIEDKVL